MRPIWLSVAMLMILSGCAGRKSSLLLERQTRGSLSEEALVGRAVPWHLQPVTQTKTQKGMEVTVTYASREFLKGFFSNRATFGDFAGTNPFFPEHLVFYVKIANHGDKKITINPGEFAVTDDRGNQYHVLGQDYITAFAESRQPMATLTRGVLEEARPGYFGVSLPVGKIFAAKPQGRLALLSQSALKPGPLFPGTVYDGLISFWSPPAAVKTLRLLLTEIKTDFDADDLPKTSVDFVCEFDAVQDGNDTSQHR